MAEGSELMNRLMSENADLKKQVRLMKENQMLKRLLSESCQESCSRGGREPLFPRGPAYPEACSPGCAGEARPRPAPPHPPRVHAWSPVSGWPPEQVQGCLRWPCQKGHCGWSGRVPPAAQSHKGDSARQFSLPRLPARWQWLDPESLSRVWGPPTLQ